MIQLLFNGQRKDERTHILLFKFKKKAVVTLFELLSKFKHFHQFDRSLKTLEKSFLRSLFNSAPSRRIPYLQLYETQYNDQTAANLIGI